MNLTELRERTRRLSGIRSTDLLTDADLDATLNEVYREIAGVVDWPFLYLDASVVTVAGEPRVAVPAARKITSVYVSSPVEAALAQVTPEQLDTLPSEDEGEPSVFAVVATAGVPELHLWPTPDTVYTVSLRGYADVVDLTAGDEPVWAAEFHPLVAFAAAARLLAEEGDDSGRMGMYGQEVTSALSRMRSRYMQAASQRGFQMGGRSRKWS